MPRSSPTAAGCASAFTVLTGETPSSGERDPVESRTPSLQPGCTFQNHTDGSERGLAPGHRTPKALCALCPSDRMTSETGRRGGRADPPGAPCQQHSCRDPPRSRGADSGQQGWPRGSRPKVRRLPPSSARGALLPLPGAAGWQDPGRRPAGKFLATGCPLPPATRSPRAGPATGTHLGAATAAS